MPNPNTLVIVLFVSLTCVVVEAQVPAGYELLVQDSPLGRYTAAVPEGFSPLEPLNIREESPVGTIYGSGLQRLAQDQTTLLSMLHYLAPVGFEMGRTRQQIVLDTLNGIVGGVNGTVASQRPITLGGIEGMEAEFSASMEGTRLLGRARVFLNGTEAFACYFLLFPDGHSPDAALWHNPRGMAFLESLRFQAGVGSGGAVHPPPVTSPK